MQTTRPDRRIALSHQEVGMTVVQSSATPLTNLPESPECLDAEILLCGRPNVYG
jgi:hypothetical protein